MKRSPLKRSTKRIKRTPLARIGRRLNSKKAERADVVANVRHRDKVCQFHVYLQQAPLKWQLIINLDLDCWHSILDVHEIIPRSAWPDGELVESNCVLICRRHHIWIDQHPELAHEIGLHGFSWERP